MCDELSLRRAIPVAFHSMVVQQKQTIMGGMAQVVDWHRSGDRCKKNAKPFSIQRKCLVQLRPPPWIRMAQKTGWKSEEETSQRGYKQANTEVLTLTTTLKQLQEFMTKSDHCVYVKTIS